MFDGIIMQTLIDMVSFFQIQSQICFQMVAFGQNKMA